MFKAIDSLGGGDAVEKSAKFQGSPREGDTQIPVYLGKDSQDQGQLHLAIRFLFYCILFIYFQQSVLKVVLKDENINTFVRILQGNISDVRKRMYTDKGVHSHFGNH